MAISPLLAKGLSKTLDDRGTVGIDNAAGPPN